MKKILFGTTALLAAGAFTSSAQASDPIKLSLGGYMEYYVVAAAQDDDAQLDTNNFDVIGDAEVWFGGKTTLDNGMEIGVDVQLEAGTRSGGDDVDESYMWLSGKYGKLIVGSENDVAYKMGISAPSVSAQGAAGNDDTINDYLLDNDVERLMVVSTLTGDANKLSYFTPRYYGFQAGISYSPSGDTAGDDTGATVTRQNDWDQAWAFALDYKETWSGVGVKAGVNYSILDDGTHTVEDNFVESTQGGLVLSYMGFSFGGGVQYLSANEDTNYAASEGWGWNVGASYKEGPYGVSLTYYQSDVEGTSVADGGDASEDDETKIVQLAGTYALGKGVSLIADLDYMDAEDDTNVNSAGNEGAYGAAVGLKLKF